MTTESPLMYCLVFPRPRRTTCDPTGVVELLSYTVVHELPAVILMGIHQCIFNGGNVRPHRVSIQVYSDRNLYPGSCHM